MKIKNNIKVISTNRKAKHDYEILFTIQAGIKLLGPEVKSCRSAFGIQLQGSYILIDKGELKLLNCNIPHYSNSGYLKYNEVRERILLVHKKEILKLSQQVKEKGLTLIPLQIYFDKNLVKIDVGVCRGKHLYDKREDLKKKQLQRESSRKIQ